MKKQARKKQGEKETLTDWLKGIGLVGIPLWILLFFLCCVGINECRDRHSKKEPTPPPYSIDDIYNQHSSDDASTGSKRHIKPVQSEEYRLIDKLSGEDYYDYSDYNDGLDGVHSDIDYNDVMDYYVD